MSYASGVADCVRIVARIAEELENRPALADVEALGANPRKRRAMSELFLFAAQEMAALIPVKRGDDGNVVDGSRAADTAREPRESAGTRD